MVVKCTITAEGAITNRQIIKPVPHMEAPCCSGWPQPSTRR